MDTNHSKRTVTKQELFVLAELLQEQRLLPLKTQVLSPVEEVFCFLETNGGGRR